MREFLIQKNEADQRFDKYLKKLLGNAPGSFIYKMLRKKNIVLNDKKADGTEKLKPDDHVKLYLSEETFLKFATISSKDTIQEKFPKVNLKQLPFQIIYETEDILMINKPSGMLSQKAKPEDVSANEYIISYLLATGVLKPEELSTFRPSICNRLDRNTSGILIAGKTLTGLQQMSEKLKTRSIRKYYQCIVTGQITTSCHIQGYLKKDEVQNKVFISEEKNTETDKWIETEYIPIRTFSNATLLEVHLITGRAHQIRAHLSSVGHPIIGDYKYGEDKLNQHYKKACGIHSQLLHAYRIQMENGENITAPLPNEFQKVLNYLEEKE